MEERYVVNKFSGGVYCGNAFFNSFEECMEFGEDGCCDYIRINDTKENKTYKIHIYSQEV